MKRQELEFQDVYKEFHGKIHRYLQQMVGPNEAEDVTQEVFLKVDKGLAEFQGRSELSTWVYRIATHAALDRLRSRAGQESRTKIRLDEGTDESQGADAGVRVEDICLSAEREAIRNEMNECIREFVDRLPENYRTVVILSELKDLKDQEVAEILGISLEAAKIRLHRARVRLKAELEAGCDFYHDENSNLACDRKNPCSKENPE
jgi:RNA polymerase sigma-70 factor (ECF subfamily)